MSVLTRFPNSFAGVLFFVLVTLLKDGNATTCLDEMWVGTSPTELSDPQSPSFSNGHSQNLLLVSKLCEQIGLQVANKDLVPTLMELSKSNAPEAQYAMGVFLIGAAAPEGLGKARELFKLAAEHNIPRAIAANQAIASGFTTEKWREYQFTARRAILGNADAQFRIGTWARSDHGYRLEKIGIEWIERAAKQGLVRAQALMYQLIRNSDPQTSRKWLEVAALGGDVHSQFMIGRLEIEQENSLSAHQWFLLAASSGHSNARINLGQMYERGLGVSENKSIAYALYFLSVNYLGDVWSELEKYDPPIADGMTMNEIATGKQLIKEVIQTNNLKGLIEKVASQKN